MEFKTHVQNILVSIKDSIGTSIKNMCLNDEDSQIQSNDWNVEAINICNIKICYHRNRNFLVQMEQT